MPLLDRGKAWLRAIRRILRKLRVSASGQMVLTEVPVPGGTLLVDPTSDPGWKLFEGGGYEDSKRQCLATLVQEDDVVLEAGASYGIHTVDLAELAQHVLAVEPAPRSCRHLQANLALNGIDNVTVLAAALGAEEGEVQLHVTGDQSFSSVAETSRDLIRKRTTVRATTVDALVAGTGRAPTVYKLDAEGSELAILDGAQQTLAGADRPRFVLMEVEPRNARFHGYDVDALFEAMKAHGYAATSLSGESLDGVREPSTGERPEEVVFYDRGSERAKGELRTLRSECGLPPEPGDSDSRAQDASGTQ